MSQILVAIPIKPTLNITLKRKCQELAHRMVEANPDHEFAFIFDYRKVQPLVGDDRAWSKVARARNRILGDLDTSFKFDFVLWVDADVVDYPADMPTKLLAGNPIGISAPLVLIEKTKRMYDWAACIMKDRSGVKPENPSFIFGRNLSPDYPYWMDEQNGVIEMDCVGTITMVPAQIYLTCIYENHPSMTDHFPICKLARENGLQVTIDTNIIAYHADLTEGNYPGESWH